MDTLDLILVARIMWAETYRPLGANVWQIACLSHNAETAAKFMYNEPLWLGSIEELDWADLLD